MVKKDTDKEAEEFLNLVDHMIDDILPDAKKVINNHIVPHINDKNNNSLRSLVYLIAIGNMIDTSIGMVKEMLKDKNLTEEYLNGVIDIIYSMMKEREVAMLVSKNKEDSDA